MQARTTSISGLSRDRSRSGERPRGDKGGLDETDIKIIQALKKDSRQNLTELAKNVGISRPTVYKRMEYLVKGGFIEFDLCVNIAKLGFTTAHIGLEVKSREDKKKLVEVLEKCPRVLLLTCNTTKSNVSAYIYGENMDTLSSHIESLREFQGAEIVYVFHSGSQTYPRSFRISMYPEKGDKAPCGMNCSKCQNYSQNLCLGCPATKDYRGFL